MSRCRALVVLLALALVLPSAAFAQGAGDEQYQDPFGDEPAQSDGAANSRAAQDDGLSEEPPVDGEEDGDDGGANGGANGDDGDDGAPPAGEQGEEPKALPNTGSDPRMLAFAGLLFVLVGVGLRLRTIDPDAF